MVERRTNTQTTSSNRSVDSPRPVWANLAVSLWVSFLSAGIATMLFFSSFDPTVIADVATFPIDLDRTAGYSIGFLLFWLLLFINSCVVLFLSTPATNN